MPSILLLIEPLIVLYINTYDYLNTDSPKYYKKIINIPCSTNLSEDDVDKVIEVLTEFVKSR